MTRRVVADKPGRAAAQAAARQVPALSDAAGSTYHRPLPGSVPEPVPGADCGNWGDLIRPRAAMDRPEGHLLVKMGNAHPTSATPDGCRPGQTVALPHDEAREIIRQGYGREVIPVE